MKKIPALFLSALILLLTLTSCSSVSDRGAKAYEKIGSSYTRIDKMAHDIELVWDKAINNTKELKGYWERYSYYYSSDSGYDYSKGYDYFCEGLNLDESQIQKGIAYTLYGEAYAEKSEEAVKMYEKIAGASFSTLISVIVNAYKFTVDYDLIYTDLEFAKQHILKLSEKHTEYYYFEYLEGYFSNTLTYLELCTNPWGESLESFKSMMSVVNSSNKKYISQLRYVYEESLSTVEETSTQATV